VSAVVLVVMSALAVEDADTGLVTVHQAEAEGEEEEVAATEAEAGPHAERDTTPAAVGQGLPLPGRAGTAAAGPPPPGMTTGLGLPPLPRRPPADLPAPRGEGAPAPRERTEMIAARVPHKTNKLNAFNIPLLLCTTMQGSVRVERTK
jgi:hypothetical protein